VSTGPRRIGGAPERTRQGGHEISTTNARRRPGGVTLLAILAGLAGFAGVVHALQYLHLVPVILGPLAFYGFDPLGAVLWAIAAVIWTWVAASLWYMNPQVWLFVVALSVINLLLDGLAVLGGSTFWALLPSILVNAIVLLYCLTPGVRRAFDVPAR
jgi:hypothetical protein